MSTPDDPGRAADAVSAGDAATARAAADGGDAVGGTGTSPEPAAPVGWLPRSAEDLFGAGARAEETYELLTVDVPAESWIPALQAARTELGCTYFDWLSAVDEPGTGLRVAAHVAALPTADAVARAERAASAGAQDGAELPEHAPGGAEPAGPTGLRRLLVRTTVPHDAPTLPTAIDVYPGAAWHERETHEMFGVDFTDHPNLVPLLLPDGFEGHPLRKDFVLAARVAKAWPGAKEPGESDHGGPKRRQMLPPGVPDPNDWGPLKGQLPPAPARPARGARAAGGPAAKGDRPVRRTRSVSAGSASQQAATDAQGAQGAAVEPGPEGAAQAGAPAARPPRRARSASAGSASQRAAGEEHAGADEAATPAARPARRTPDAPWHDARPATDTPSVSRERPAAPRATTPAPDTEATPASAPEVPAATPAPDPETPPAAPAAAGEQAAPAASTEAGGADGPEPATPSEPEAKAATEAESASEPAPAPGGESESGPEAEAEPGGESAPGNGSADRDGRADGGDA
ncbi:NADH-quinone oxidoreductase subunit C [Streptomyces buecherae]|uniref:NADH-quinone oxidoreductase subunit C n=2 Tax=Streptomyces buecherae TaxID=2763006 RepID=UPI00164D8FAE|nr:NADH-quinone oxidoreductase subunit C [Streptomyces buecherae]QNJ40729.1 NADH-quinone oxidoreductase subunit C [Streptomyces buecherae]